jgi:hypothetical protein
MGQTWGAGITLDSTQPQGVPCSQWQSGPGWNLTSSEPPRFAGSRDPALWSPLTTSAFALAVPSACMLFSRTPVAPARSYLSIHVSPRTSFFPLDVRR